MNKPIISILLPAYKSEQLLKKVFFGSFWENTKSQCELVIYDNGGNDSALNTTRVNDEPWSRPSSISVNNLSQKNIGDATNIGLHAAYNECVKVAEGNWFYLPHSDMYLLPNWDQELLNATRGQVPSKILLCSRSVEPMKGHTDHHRILDFGKTVDEFVLTKNGLLDWYSYQYQGTQESQRIEIGARMPFFLHRSLLDKMADFNQKNGICDGPFDDHYFSYCQDDDIIQTAWHLGVRRFHMAWGSLVYHLGGQSNKQQNVDRDSNKPYDYFKEKWRRWYPNMVKHPGQWHPEIIPFGTTIR